MSIQKIQSEFDKLSNILNNNIIADECTAGTLKEVHDQLQEAILSGDPAQYLRNKKITQQLLLFEETSPVVGKVIKDIMNTLAGMGI